MDTIPCVVRWGERPEVRVYSATVAASGGLLGEESTVIPFSELADFATISGRSAGESRILEVDWPFELGRSGALLVDTPGLDESPGRTRIVEQFLGRPDVIVFVTSATMPLGTSERSMLDHLMRNHYHDGVFLLVNMIDEIDVSDHPDIISHVRRIIEQGLPVKPDRVFFVSSRQALKGRESADSELFEKSRFALFEHALGEFIRTGRHEMKVIAPAVTLRAVLNKMEVDRSLPEFVEAQRSLANVIDGKRPPPATR